LTIEISSVAIMAPSVPANTANHAPRSAFSRRAGAAGIGAAWADALEAISAGLSAR